MALRLPAGLKTPQQLWEFLLAGGDARCRVPSSRYNVAAFHDPAGKSGTVISEYGYFLDEDIGALDTSFFSMPRWRWSKQITTATHARGYKGMS